MSGATWRERLAERPPMADWYRRRHHCSDVVLGIVDTSCDNRRQAPMPQRKGTAVKRILSVATVLAAVFAIALAGNASATDTNHTDYWAELYDAECAKFEPRDQSAPVDFWFRDGVVLRPGEYVVLVLKSALVNDVYEDPTPGNLYVTKSGKDISHIIVCTPKEVEPSATPSVEPSPSPEPSSTPSPQPSSTPDPSPSPSVEPTPSPTSSPEPSGEPSPTPSTTPTSAPSSSPSTPTDVVPTPPPTDTETTTQSTGSLAFALLVALFLIATMWMLANTPSRK